MSVVPSIAIALAGVSGVYLAQSPWRQPSPATPAISSSSPSSSSFIHNPPVISQAPIQISKVTSIYQDSYRSGRLQRITLFSEPTDRMPITLEFAFKDGGNIISLTDVCIIEVLSRTNGTGSANPDDPLSRAAQDPSDLPEPFIDQPNRDEWRLQYQHKTKFMLSKTINGIKIEGTLQATWGNKNCKTNSINPGKLYFSVDGTYMWLNDYHGTDPITQPIPGKAYKIGGGYNVRQYYLWYVPGMEQDLRFLAGPFFIRRWVWGLPNASCKSGDLRYYMNVSKYKPNGNLISEKVLKPSLGCGGSTIKAY